MATTITSQDLQAKFQAVFGEKADHTFFSPGRINLCLLYTSSLFLMMAGLAIAMMIIVPLVTGLSMKKN